MPGPTGLHPEEVLHKIALNSRLGETRLAGLVLFRGIGHPSRHIVCRCSLAFWGPSSCVPSRNRLCSNSHGSPTAAAPRPFRSAFCTVRPSIMYAA